jgi:LysM repeat protein
VADPTALQPQASVRLLLPLMNYPRAKHPVPVAWHVLEAFIKQLKVISSRDAGPGQSNGDISCSGFITRGAEVPGGISDPWAWLDAALVWQDNAFRPIHTSAPRPVPDTDPVELWTPPQRVLEPPVEMGVAWLGDLDDLEEAPTSIPPAPRAHLYGCTLLTAGFPFGEGGIGRLVQPQLGEAIEFVLKPHRVFVTEPGDTLQICAERFGTTVQTLRTLNSFLAPEDTVLTVAGDTLLSLAGQYGTTVEWLMAHNPTLARFGPHVVVEGDTLKTLAVLYETTPPTLRTYNAPTYDLWSQSDPLPVGAELIVPLDRPSTLLDPGQALTVPLYRPSTLLPHTWLHLPPRRRSLADPDDRSYLDPPEEPPAEPTP